MLGASDTAINALRYVHKNAPQYYKQMFSLIVCSFLFFKPISRFFLDSFGAFYIFISFLTDMYSEESLRQAER